LAFAIEAVEFGGDPRSCGWILGKQKVDAKRRAPNAAAGVDARAKKEAEVPRLRRAAEPGHVHQRRETRVVAAAQREQTFGHESAVKALERDHVGDGAGRDKV